MTACKRCFIDIYDFVDFFNAITFFQPNDCFVAYYVY